MKRFFLALFAALTLLGAHAQVTTDATKTGGYAAAIQVLANSAVAASVTGTTNETTLATVTVPAGAVGANGLLRITTLWSVTNNANNKTVRHKLGSTTVWTASPTSTASGQFQSITRARNSTSSQVTQFSSTTNFGTSANAQTTSSLDFTGAVTLTITAQLATSTDTATLEAYTVEYLP